MAGNSGVQDKLLQLSAGELRVVRHGVHVLVFEPRGHLSLEMAQAMIAEAERVIEEVGTIHALHDWEQVTGYDALGRLELTKFVFVDRSKFSSAHLLVKARNVAFGVEVANIVLKNKITVHHSRDSFDRALQRILQGEHIKPARV